MREVTNTRDALKATLKSLLATMGDEDGNQILSFEAGHSVETVTLDPLPGEAAVVRGLPGIHTMSIEVTWVDKATREGFEAVLSERHKERVRRLT